ncbi:VOC family protein, partial [Saccharopolyspora gregorii]|uniref:VOC family protein n=1 Tax=Saccharopolyspora gregorii TaxID=33914 RepID=UPI0031EC064C
AGLDAGALGFRPAGRHRSKPVRLWEQGDARILVNTGPDRPEHRGGGALAAIGVHSADPRAATRRAEGLLAPVLPRSARPDEADLSSVAAPDGTALFFCRTGADRDASWLGDFDPEPGGTAGAGVTGIDHVAMTQPFDHFDEAILFYRSVLGLDPEPPVEFAAPFGLVRSRLVLDPGGTVRLALDSAVLRRGSWAPAVPNPQHVALSTDDVFATARAVRELGAPVVAIPDNYYDDLDAGWSWTRSSRRGCGSARCSTTGTRAASTCTSRWRCRLAVFFEVVQRVGGYRGRGEHNTPVRMAAHRRRRLATGS